MFQGFNHMISSGLILTMRDIDFVNLSKYVIKESLKKMHRSNDRMLCDLIIRHNALKSSNMGARNWVLLFNISFYFLQAQNNPNYGGTNKQMHALSLLSSSLYHCCAILCNNYRVKTQEDHHRVKTHFSIYFCKT